MVLFTISLVLASCNKESSVTDLNLNTEVRSVDGDGYQKPSSLISGKSILWIDSLRNNLYNNNSADYSVDDAVIGMDIILNLYKTQGVGNFKQYEVAEKSYTIDLNNFGRISVASMRIFFEKVYSANKEMYSNSLLENKVLGEIRIQVVGGNSTEVKVNVTTIIGSHDINSIVDSLLLDDDGTECKPTFKEDDCYVTGLGDVDDNRLYGGGDCNGNKIDKTAAHEEVQKKFTRKIPKIVSIKKGNQYASYIVKFVKQDCKYLDIWSFYNEYNNFSNCPNNLMSDDYGDMYDNEALDCAYCVVNNWVRETIPSGYELCYMNIWTDISTGGGNTPIKWFIEICWGEAILIPIAPVFDLLESSQVESDAFIIHNDPYCNLGSNITVQLGY